MTQYARPLSDKAEDDYALHRAYRQVFQTPAGQQVYSHITKRLCMIDRQVSASLGHGGTDVLIARAAIFDVGREIERMTLAPIPEQKRPEVKTNE